MAISSPCAIEMEPKTLKPGQINHAKELAVRIAQKMEPPEALDFFIKGVRHGSLDGREQIAEESYGEGRSPKDVNDSNSEIEHYCLCSTRIIDSPVTRTQREPLTAPF